MFSWHGEIGGEVAVSWDFGQAFGFYVGKELADHRLEGPPAIKELVLGEFQHIAQGGGLFGVY